jgi:hypothetical protein
MRQPAFGTQVQDLTSVAGHVYNLFSDSTLYSGSFSGTAFNIFNTYTQPTGIENGLNKAFSFWGYGSVTPNDNETVTLGFLIGGGAGPTFAFSGIATTVYNWNLSGMCLIYAANAMRCNGTGTLSPPGTPAGQAIASTAQFAVTTSGAITMAFAVKFSTSDAVNFASQANAIFDQQN